MVSKTFTFTKQEIRFENVNVDDSEWPHGQIVTWIAKCAKTGFKLMELQKCFSEDFLHHGAELTDSFFSFKNTGSRHSMSKWRKQCSHHKHDVGRYLIALSY